MQCVIWDVAMMRIRRRSRGFSFPFFGTMCLSGYKSNSISANKEKPLQKKDEEKKKHAMSDFQRHTVDKASDCPACPPRRFVRIQLAERKPEAITSSDCRQSRPCPPPPPHTPSNQHQHPHPPVSDSNLNAGDLRLAIRGWGESGGGCLWSGDKVDWLVDSSSQSGTELGEK